MAGVGTTHAASLRWLRRSAPRQAACTGIIVGGMDAGYCNAAVCHAAIHGGAVLGHRADEPRSESGNRLDLGGLLDHHLLPRAIRDDQAGVPGLRLRGRRDRIHRSPLRRARRSSPDRSSAGSATRITGPRARAGCSRCSATAQCSPTPRSHSSRPRISTATTQQGKNCRAATQCGAPLPPTGDKPLGGVT